MTRISINSKHLMRAIAVLAIIQIVALTAFLTVLRSNEEMLLEALMSTTQSHAADTANTALTQGEKPILEGYGVKTMDEFTAKRDAISKDALAHQEKFKNDGPLLQAWSFAFLVVTLLGILTILFLATCCVRGQENT